MDAPDEVPDRTDPGTTTASRPSAAGAAGEGSAGAWRTAAVAGFSLQLALIAGDAPLVSYLVVAILACIAAVRWQEVARIRRGAVPWILSILAFGAAAIVLSPMAWPWAAVLGLAAFAVQLPLARRVG